VPEQFALIVHNPVLRSRLEEVAQTAGAEAVAFRSPQALSLEEPPALIVVELEQDGAIDAISEWKARWPSCFIVGALSIPKADLWNAGMAAGCTLIANAGALPRQLRQKLEEEAAGKGKLEVPRLLVRLNPREGDGVVGNLPDAPDGPIVVYRVNDRLHAILDVCPHAGASLADGALEGSIVTCARHGSQLDVWTGERARGPADFPVRTYPVVEEGGSVYVELT
jgi:3-phenylpropionate/trans-cinnamate dioxygenase ferredoxin subunit